MAKIRFQKDRLKSTIEKLKSGQTPLKTLFKDSGANKTMPTIAVNDIPAKTGYEGYHRDM